MKNRVEGHPDLYKDSNSGVINNRSNSDRLRYRQAKRQAEMTNESRLEIDELKNEITEIKTLLHQILNK